MTNNEIKELRKKQILSLNVYIIIVYALASLTIIFLDPTRFTVFTFLVIFLTISCILTSLELRG